MDLKYIVKRVEHGDHIDNDELDKAINHYKTLVGLLEVHGILYELTCRDANKRLQTLQQYQQSRERNK